MCPCSYEPYFTSYTYTHHTHTCTHTRTPTHHILNQNPGRRGWVCIYYPVNWIQSSCMNMETFCHISSLQFLPSRSTDNRNVFMDVLKRGEGWWGAVYSGILWRHSQPLKAVLGGGISLLLPQRLKTLFCSLDSSTTEVFPLIYSKPSLEKNTVALFIRFLWWL